LIDPRLFPLLETLSASNLDWLVVDVLGAVTAGDVALEPEDALVRVRDVIRLGRERRAEEVSQLRTSAGREWSGDEQIKIAAEIVLRRIEEVLVMSESSLALIDALIGGDRGTQSTDVVDGIAYATDDGDFSGSMTLDKIGLARESLGGLRRAVEEWLSDAIRGAAR
jgi:hypothetical protein